MKHAETDAREAEDQTSDQLNHTCTHSTPYGRSRTPRACRAGTLMTVGPHDGLWLFLMLRTGRRNLHRSAKNVVSGGSCYRHTIRTRSGTSDGASLRGRPRRRAGETTTFWIHARKNSFCFADFLGRQVAALPVSRERPPPVSGFRTGGRAAQPAHHVQDGLLPLKQTVRHLLEPP
jgi:hypothetical protein